MPSKESEDGAVRPENKRAGDADRKAVAERLRVALDEGRLDLSEYDERLQASYTAKTFAELDLLTADIPGVAPASSSQVERVSDSEPDRHADRRERRRRRREGRHDHHNGTMKLVWSGWGASAIFFTGIWAVTWMAKGGTPPYYWPMWILGIWGIGALAATWNKITKD